MALDRLSDVQKEISKLNRQLAKIQQLESRVDAQDSRIAKVNRDFQDLQHQTEFDNANTLTISWDGPNTKFTWTAGYTRDKNGTIYQIPSGQYTGLTAATHYWFGWNPVHQTMSVQTDLTKLTAIDNIIVLFRIHSGGAGVTATAGGGGQESGGSDLNGGKYALL